MIIWIYIVINILTVLSTPFHLRYISKTDVEFQKPLPDLFYNVLPDLSNQTSLIFVLDYIIPFVIFPVAIYTNKILFTYKFLSIIFFLRAIAKVITTLPSSCLNCKNNSSMNSMSIGYCNDKIFSGHVTLTLVALLLILQKNSQYSNILIFLHLIYSILIIAVRNHYSIDVFIAYVIVISMFYNLSSPKSNLI